MPTAAERQAVAFLATVALLGGGVRLVQGYSFERALAAAEAPVAAEAITAQLEAVDSARRVKVRPRSRALGAGEAPIDPDVASETELDRLPRVGPALARRIVANRDSFGPFGSLEELQRVRGIGPALAAGLAPHVTFSSGYRPLHGKSKQRRAP
jgi:predicted flap endonuclease-1-like 5' DNA nuclease